MVSKFQGFEVLDVLNWSLKRCNLETLKLCNLEPAP
jgi:hypothetical protein